MRDKIISTIEKYNMLQKGDSVIVGLSGGPDSACLLHVLASIRDIYDIKIYAVHLNHMIRGAEAQRDEEFAGRFAQSLGIPFYSRRIKVEEYAAENKMTSEEAGRFLRYNLFDEISQKVGGNKIALAHNMNDQAETVIMHFLRGSGITGLSGIKPCRDNKYIRPLILCSRTEIENYCASNGLNPVIDSTNNEEIYLRNKIRLDFIPYVREKFNPNIVETISKSSEILREENEFLLKTAENEIKRITQNNDELLVKEFNELDLCIKRRVIRSLIEKAKGDLNGIEIKHIEDCIDMIRKGHTGKKINLPDNIECSIQYGMFRIHKTKRLADYEYELCVPGDIYVEEEDMFVHIRIFEKSSLNLIEKHFVKYFDYDKIKDTLKIRNRRDGDYIYPAGMQGKKKLKEYFIDKKIPRDQRDYKALLALGSEILWIPGQRDTKNYKIDQNTKNIIEISIERGAHNERSSSRNSDQPAGDQKQG